MIARSAKNGVLAGHFFGPRRAKVPDLLDLSTLSPEDALLIGHFGSLGVETGSWPVLGVLPGWDRDLWRMPPLYRYQEINDAAYRVEYDDLDPSRRLNEVRVSVNEAIGRPRASLMGDVFAQNRLERIMRTGS
ncbi:hypothetical protein [Gryllotalpicola protaetiae]|uniref:hypothetical protein n=1 Tax=Gryllotalpicola protaetiae TaxID=2419771 RepID=UPI003CCC883A